MNTFVEYKKMSKKQQREYNQSKRRDWNGVNPVTKVVPNKKAYNRNNKSWMKEAF